MAAARMEGDQNAGDCLHNLANSPVMPRAATVNWPSGGVDIKSNNRRFRTVNVEAVTLNIAIDSGGNAGWEVLLDGVLSRSTRDTERK